MALLESAGLPATDITRGGLQDFIVALDAGEIIGAAGLERHGEHGLLRSLVVAPDWRGHGLGAALVEAVEAKARLQGVRSLSLLTGTAAPFFAVRGYAAITRDRRARGRTGEHGIHHAVPGQQHLHAQDTSTET